MQKRETKSFTIPIKESIISKLFKILNHIGNIGKKKFRAEIITPSFFVSFSSFLTESFVSFCSLLKYFLLQSWRQVFHYSPGGKLVIYPGFSNGLSETLWTYTFYVMVFNWWWNKVNHAKGLENKITQQNSSRPEVVCTKGVLRGKFTTGKHLPEHFFFL